MKKWTNYLPADFSSQLTAEVFTEDALFFDIETTGFSPSGTHVYLIGCARRKNNTVIVEQYFAESGDEEILILSEFLALLKNYQTFITFHGVGFDIPYLRAKYHTCHMEDPFIQKTFLDLFKIASSMKFLLKLPNYKQKSVEAFLDIHREDAFNGGELISIYQEYQKYPNEEQLLLLKQHNYEDVTGMLDLLPILNYTHLFNGDFHITGMESNTYRNFSGLEQKELIFTLKNDHSLPKQVSCRYQDFYLVCNEETSNLCVQLYEGELKFFFENYKDYYYLPAEDTAIHKDIAAFVDREYRKKATAATCYTRKTSLFLPQYTPLRTPVFRKNYKDKLTYFELTDDFINSPQQIYEYIRHILKAMSLQKR